MRRPRTHRGDDRRSGPAEPGRPAPEIGESELAALATVFTPPQWLRDLGVASWSLVGAIALVIGAIWLLGETQTIVNPVLGAAIAAVVATPVVGWLHRKGAPRAVGALLVLLGVVALGVAVVLVVVGGIVSQAGEISVHASAAVDEIEGWLKSAGLSDSGASSVSDALKQDAPQIVSTLVRGVQEGISGITSLVFALSFTVFGLFFLLKDGPAFRSALDRHLGVPVPVARVITGDVIESVRRYFLGVTIVAVFNAVVVGLGALALGVPLAGTIAVVTWVTAYVPFIGAVVSGAFAVLLALGSEGMSTALVMLVIVILANGLLQNIVQPIAFGATLDLNPLVVLFVTIAAGSLFGMFGLVLAAPLTSAAVHIVSDLGRARGVRDEPVPVAEPPPEPPAPAPV